MNGYPIWFPQKMTIRDSFSRSAITQGVAIIRAMAFKRRERFMVFTMALTLISNPVSVIAQNFDNEYCLTREGRVSVVGVEVTRLYERKLCVTKDDLARYVFLTNAKTVGDNSVAVYRALGRDRSLRGDYWVTATEVATSLGADLSVAREKRLPVDAHNFKVRRADAPIPASTAQIVHELWLTMLERSRVNERAVPCSPTAIISATTARGLRLKAVTVSLDDDSVCLALMRLGLSLLNYPDLPATQRARAAREIERESQLLLKRVNQTR